MWCFCLYRSTDEKPTATLPLTLISIVYHIQIPADIKYYKICQSHINDSKLFLRSVEKQTFSVLVTYGGKSSVSRVTKSKEISSLIISCSDISKQKTEDKYSSFGTVRISEIDFRGTSGNEEYVLGCPTINNI